MSDYQEDIQRLAKGPRMKGALPPIQKREPIRGQVTPFNDDTFAPTSRGPAGGTNTACSPTDEDGEEQDEELENIDPEDPNTFYRGGVNSTEDKTDEGTYDVGDVIDGSAGPQSAPGSDGSPVSGALRELTGLKDCESGTPFNLHVDGNFIPPEGWDDPETPAVDDEYEDGFYWRGQIEVYTLVPNDRDSEQNLSYSNSAVDSWAREYLEDQKQWLLANTDPTNYFIVEGASVGENYYLRLQRGSGSEVYTDVNIDKLSCPEDPIEPYCPAVPPTADSWPEDGTYDLAIKDGQLQTSEFDADKPRDEALGTKPFCFGEDRTGEARVTADGGLMVYETANGAPTGAATVYDSSGDFRAAGDATNTFINQYLPK